MTGSAYRPPLAASAVLVTAAMMVAQIGVIPAAAHASTATGSVSTVVRDADTGQPARACASLIPLEREEYTQVYLGEDQDGRFGGCTGTQGGALAAHNVDPGFYQVFVESYYSSQHGWQWVGWNGGTGQRQWARVIRVRPGTNTVLPDIRLDPPGSITGVVTDAAGKPVRAVDVAVVPYVPHPKYGRVPITDDDGRFTVTGLGPYNWPLQFSGYLIATQWSGGVANRLLARTARVRSGQTATLNQVLRAPTWITGSIAVDELPSYSQVVAFNVSTGDIAGAVDVGGTYQLPMLPGQVVKLRCDCAYAPSVWHNGKAGFTEATPVWVGGAPISIDFDLRPVGPLTAR